MTRCGRSNPRRKSVGASQARRSPETKTETIQRTKSWFETFKPKWDLAAGFLDFLFHLLDGFTGFVIDEDILNVTEPEKRRDVITVQQLGSGPAETWQDLQN